MTSWNPKHLRYVLKLCASIAKHGDWQRREMITDFLVVRAGLDMNTALQLAHGDVTPNEVMRSLFPEVGKSEVKSKVSVLGNS